MKPADFLGPMAFSCGCQPPTYCPTHAHWECHTFLVNCAGRCILTVGECPVCRNARWRSVNLDSRATPTRRER